MSFTCISSRTRSHDDDDAAVVPLANLSLQGLLASSLCASSRMMALTLRRSGLANHSRNLGEMDRGRLVELLTDALAVVAEQYESAQ
jgi:hypothetical protein